MRRILIIGLGQVGSFLTEKLSDSQEVVIVEKDGDLVRKVSETHDVLAYEGSGDDLTVLREAGIEKADVVVAVTGDDKTNMLASLVAHTFGVDKIVASVSEASYGEYPGILKDSKISVVSPSKIVSEITNALIGSPFATSIESFGGGKMELLKLRVEPGASIINEKLRNIEISTVGQQNWVFVGLQRKQDIIVPRGDTEFLEGDFVFALGIPSALRNLVELFNLRVENIRTVIVVGDGKVGRRVAADLHSKGLSVRLIERDPEMARMASEELLGVMVFQGDGTDIDLLREAGLEESDFLFALTSDDENNVLSALLAKRHGINRCMVLYSNPSYLDVIESIGIDRVVSVRLEVANDILGELHLRGEKNLTLLHEGEGELLEFEVTKRTKILGKKLEECKFPPGFVIGACVRPGQENLEFPRGDFIPQLGDRLVVFSLPTAVEKVEEILV